jgi:hypothetical protein
MGAWRARLDLCVMLLGGIVAHVGLVAQVGGFVLAFLLGDPITGYRWLTHGFWIAGLGGAGMVYGMNVDAGTPGRYEGGRVTYERPARRWVAALWSIALTPLWGVLSLPLGLLFYTILIVGGLVFGAVELVRLCRRTA